MAQQSDFFKKGPDQTIPASEYSTTNRNGRVNLRIPNAGKAIETHPSLSVPGLLHRTVVQSPEVVALKYKKNGKWHDITYKEYENEVRTCAKAFIALGLERYNAVCILGFNSPEWFISDLAAIYAGGLACGIYTTNSSEACYHCLSTSQANIVVVQDEKQLAKIQAIRNRLPFLKAVIQYDGIPSTPDVLSWKHLMQIGKSQTDEKLNKILKSIAVNECCTLVYTSGTVGKPKGVMLSHDNLTWDALAIGEKVQVEYAKEVLISYLPLSHVAAQVVDIYIAISLAATVGFADKDALKGSLVDTLLEIQPTRFFAVPRVWEKIQEKMVAIGKSNGIIKQTLASWARGQAFQHNLDLINRKQNTSWGYTLAHALVLKRIHQALGLGRCKTCFAAAAPLSTDVKKFFLSLDLPIMDAFGMSECAGAHTLSVDTAFNLESIGVTLPGAKTRIDKPDKDGHGEICMWGRHVFMGYLDDPERTRETLVDGWLHSGDIGYVDDKGFVYITGRLKELLITAGGENIPPVPIEQQVKAILPNISNAVLIGDKKKFLSMLLTLKTEMDNETGAPLDTLTKSTKEWLKVLGCPADTVTDVLKAGPDPKLLSVINNAIDKVNQQATSNAQRIQKFAILPADFSVPTGELGPTLKLRRNIVTKKYEDVIQKFYE